MSTSFEDLKIALRTCKTTEQRVATLVQLSNPFMGNELNEVEKYGKLAIKEAKESNDQTNYEQAFFNYCHAIMYNNKTQQAKQELNKEIENVDAKTNFNYYFRINILLLNLLFLHFDIQEAYVQAKKVLNIAPKKEVSKRIGVLYSLSGSVYNKLGRYENAFMFHEKAINIFRSINDAQALSAEYNLIANVYYTMKDFEKSTYYFLENIEHSRQNNLMRNKLITIQNLCSVYFETGKIKEVKKWIDKQTTIFKTYKNEILEARFLYLKAQYITLHSDKHKDSLTFLQEAEDIFLKNKTRFQLVDLYKLKSQNLIYIKNYKEALDCALQGQKIAEKYGFTQQANAFIKTQACICKEQKKYSKAYVLLEKFVENNQKLKENERKNEIAKMRAQYEIAEKEFEAQRFKNEALNFQLQSLRAQMNPHFIFNLLNSVHSGLDEQSIEKSKMLLMRFARLMRFSLDFTEQDFVDLYEEIQFLEDYLSLEQFRNDFNFLFKIEVDENIDIDFIKIPSMLIQPLVENAIIHGVKERKNGNIQIYFTEEKEYLIVEVEDNGVGRKATLNSTKKVNSFKDNIIYESKSTKINSKRLHLLNQTDSKNVSIQYIDLFDNLNKPKGTKVRLKIKL